MAQALHALTCVPMPFGLPDRGIGALSGISAAVASIQPLAFCIGSSGELTSLSRMAD